MAVAPYRHWAVERVLPLPSVVSIVVRGFVGDFVLVCARAGDTHLANLSRKCAGCIGGAHGGPALQGVEEVG
eukprot:1194845-Lingulodinium_polyedra.AAC.1